MSNAVRVTLLLLAAASSAAAQAPVTLDGRVAPPVAAQVQALADSLSRAGIPGQPLLRKALEGSAKGVPDERIVVAVRGVAGQLRQSAGALAVARVTSDSQTIEAGAYAINAGLKEDQVAEIARSSHPPYQPAATLQSAGTLVAMGVPGSQAVSLIEDWIASGRSPGEVVSLPAKVQAAMSPGLSPSQAARNMSKGGGGGRGGPANPPGGNPRSGGNQGNPPPHPEHPEHPAHPDTPHRP
jgi:hypothetical protein